MDAFPRTFSPSRTLPTPEALPLDTSHPLGLGLELRIGARIRISPENFSVSIAAFVLLPSFIDYCYVAAISYIFVTRSETVNERKM